MKENSKAKNSKGVKMNENSKLGVNSSENSKKNSANLANSAKGVNLKANSSKNSKKNSANLANSKPNSSPNSNLGSNLKAIFALPKWAKIFLISLTALAAVGLGAAFSLKIWAADKVDSGEIVLKGIDRGAQTRILRAENVAEQEIKAFLQGAQNSVVPSKFAYQNRLYFARLDFLLRSKVIAYIDIQGISWASGVDKNAVSDISSHNRWVKFATTQDLISQGFNEKNLGKVEYKMDFSPFVKTTIKYYLLAILFVVGACAFYNSKIYVLQSEILPLSRKDYAFLALAFALCVGICAFTFWLGFPGFQCCDGTTAYTFPKQGHHPVLYSYILEFLTFLFGRHIYYLFLFNLVPFYLGLFFLIAAFYVRFRSAYSLLLIFPTFIGNIYLQNFMQYHSFALPMLLFCLYSLLLFLVLVPFWQNSQSKVARGFAKFLWVLFFILMFFAILWRHNAIFAVYPTFFVLCYLFLKNKGLAHKAFVKRYCVLMFLSALLCVGVVKGVPKILIKGEEARPAMHTFLHQMAGACVPANDASCFKDEWYNEGKSFEDIKQIYQEYPLHADYTLRVFHDYEFKEWFKAIIKYPSNFLTHRLRFFKEMWFSNEHWGQDSEGIQKLTDSKNLSNIADAPLNEQKITFTSLRESIYSFMFKHKIILNHFIGVAVGFGLMVLCGVLLLSKKIHSKFDDITLLVFAFSASFAGFWMAFFTAAFNPVTQSGYYMSPILPLSLMGLLGFVGFVLEWRCNRRLGGKS